MAVGLLGAGRLRMDCCEAVRGLIKRVHGNERCHWSGVHGGSQDGGIA